MYNIHSCFVLSYNNKKKKHYRNENINIMMHDHKILHFPRRLVSYLSLGTGERPYFSQFWIAIATQCQCVPGGVLIAFPFLLLAILVQSHSSKYRMAQHLYDHLRRTETVIIWLIWQSVHTRTNYLLCFGKWCLYEP